MKAHLYYQIRRLGVIVAAHMCVEDTVFYAVKDSHHKTVMIYLCKHHFKLDDTTLARLFKMDKKYMVTKLEEASLNFLVDEDNMKYVQSPLEAYKRLLEVEERYNYA